MWLIDDILRLTPISMRNQSCSHPNETISDFKKLCMLQNPILSVCYLEICFQKYLCLFCVSGNRMAVEPLLFSVLEQLLCEMWRRTDFNIDKNASKCSALFTCQKLWSRNQSQFVLIIFICLVEGRNTRYFYRCISRIYNYFVITMIREHDVLMLHELRPILRPCCTLAIPAKSHCTV